MKHNMVLCKNPSLHEAMGSMEGLEFVSLNWCLILVEVRKRILSTIVMSIVVRINRLSFKTRNCIELFNRGCSQTSQCTEHCTLNFCYFCILHSVNQGVLGLGSVILELLCSILLTEGCDLVVVHLKVV